MRPLHIGSHHENWYKYKTSLEDGLVPDKISVEDELKLFTHPCSFHISHLEWLITTVESSLTVNTLNVSKLT